MSLQARGLLKQLGQASWVGTGWLSALGSLPRCQGAGEGPGVAAPGCRAQAEPRWEWDGCTLLLRTRPQGPSLWGLTSQLRP